MVARSVGGRRAAASLAALAIALVALSSAAHAQSGAATSDRLRDGNTAALAGDWVRVADLVDPLFQRPLASADLAEAHRLAGIAAFFQQRSVDAERHFLAYLRIELDGRLDPALYPPDVVAFCNDVASRHAAELRALRNPSRRVWLYTLLPPLGQLQNGDRTGAYVVGGTLGALVAINLTSYALLRSWCQHTEGSGGGALTCHTGGDHTAWAQRIRPVNIASGVAAILTYAYGVYDGVHGYRIRSRELAVQPFATASRGGGVVGITGSF